VTSTAQYFRTAKGSHRHTDWHCANSHRAILLGDPLIIPADEAKDWAPCTVCCDADETTEATAPATKVRCPNTGVTHPGSRRLHDTCRDCGKPGAVNRSTGTLRAHAPAN
jgi:hypothetical protein